MSLGQVTTGYSDPPLKGRIFVERVPLHGFECGDNQPATQDGGERVSKIFPLVKYNRRQRKKTCLQLVHTKRCMLVCLC